MSNLFDSKTERRKGQKGQFFIIAAVTITLLLLNFNAALNQNWPLDTSTIQSDKSTWILTQIERDVNATVQSSFSSNQNDLDENLDVLARNWEELLAAEGYAFSADFAISWPAVDATLELRTEKVTLKKSVRFTR